MGLEQRAQERNASPTNAASSMFGDHSRVILIRRIFESDEANVGHYCVQVTK